MSFPTNVWGSSGFPFTGNGFPVKRNKLADAIILALFSNNEQGAYYDPYDLTDEKLAWVANYGSELVTNGDFSENADNWTFFSPWVYSNQRMEVQSDVFGRLQPSNLALLTIGVQYRLTFLVGGATQGRISVRATNDSSNGSEFFITPDAPSGIQTVTFTATHTSIQFFPTLNAGLPAGTRYNGWIDNISVKPVPTSAQFMAQFPNHTLFQDHLGTIPVTGNMQPLGLVLDKRFGGVRGENLYTGGDIITNPVGNSQTINVPMVLVSGQTYSISYEVIITDTDGTDGSINPDSLTRTAFGFSVSDTLARESVFLSFHATYSSDLTSFRFFKGAGVAGIIRNLSIRPILGNHAHQPVSAARPLWQNNNGIKTFYRDGVDDALNVNLPATTYTRIVAKTGTGYATNTVVHGGGALNILGLGEGNSAGYILIDRALTPTESANVETLFNQRAGV